MRFALDMCFALDMPCGARGIYIISNGCEASIYRVCRKETYRLGVAQISTKRGGYMHGRKNQLREDSIDFAVFVSDVCENMKGCSVYTNQLLRSSSSIGANIHEAKYAQSRADFINKLEIALKESAETEYWLELLYRKRKLTEDQYRELRNRCGSLRHRLIASVTTAKENTPGVRSKG